MELAFYLSVGLNVVLLLQLLHCDLRLARAMAAIADARAAAVGAQQLVAEAIALRSEALALIADARHIAGIAPPLEKS